MKRLGAMLVLAGTLTPAASAQLGWIERSEAFLRVHPRMVFDAARGRLVVIGGQDHVLRTVDTILESFDGPFVRATPSTRGPGPLWSHAIAFDAARGETVVFGGRSPGAALPLADTWAWNGVDWRALPGGPPARFAAAMVFDATRGRVVLFGGLGPSPNVPLDDTWEWDGTSWIRRLPATVPHARWGHAMAFDAQRGVTVMFGGDWQNVPVLGETWEWDGVDWRRRTPATSPFSRADHAMAFDPLRGRTVMNGGQPGTDETWEWDGTDWHRMQPAVAVPAWRHALAFDPTRQRVVMYGTYDALVHEWDGQDWSVDARRSMPFAATPGQLSWDSVRRRMVLFGAKGGPTNALWTVDAAGWHLLDSGFTATGRAPDDVRPGFGVSFDAARGVHVLFGSPAGVSTDPLWEFDGTRWRAIQASGPTPRRRHVQVWDAARARTLVFGGEEIVGSSMRTVADTWEWDGTAWRRGQPPNSPSARRDAAACYDPDRGVVVLYGGLDRTGTTQFDTWEWDGADWHAVAGSGPGRRSGASLAWDDARRRVVLCGGTTSDPRVWEWNPVTWLWSPRTVAAPPTPRERLAFAFDPERRTFVGHGGATIGTDVGLGETFELRPLHPAGVEEFGAGCPSTAHRLVPDWLPWLDTTFEIGIEGFAPGAGLVVWIGFARQSVPLDPIGMPGCVLLASTDVALPVAGAASPRATIPLPGDVSLVGGRIVLQAFGPEPGANPLGVASSSGLEATLGAR